MKKDSTPILVGCSQITQRENDPNKAHSPIDLTTQACIEAANDTNLGNKILELIKE